MKEAEIRERLKQMASEVGPDTTMIAQVKSVDEDAMTCELYDDESGLDFYDVRLRPVIDGKQSLTLVPKINSWVLAVRLEDSEDWMIIACGEFEKFKLSCDTIEINGGEKGGLVNWPDAKVQLDLVKQLITGLQNVLSTPINEPGNGSPSAFQAALNSTLSSIQVPNFDDLEDTKVKH
ncbi:hypothetical protein [Chryseosolibacter indicus]|uniref:Uncharacterized protein n=1 Tax=Chryseosolibacter indicus TaxID=2782351 RepID=A0ABS5VNE6_9BACT|nr:hypothetical protein [Chryseosolibacter indicus]MBT1702963.1 hypothetical protein [Chryseosolibacter indicus]